MTTIKLTKLIQAPPSEVFQYFTNSTDLRDWLSDIATVDARPEGRFYLGWNSNYYTSGEYLIVKPNDAVSFTWLGRGEPHATRVDVTLRKKKGGTLVKLAHRKIGKSQKWEAIGEEYEKQWDKALDNLTSVLENGPDLRITSRPLLGIYPDELNSTVAQKLGVPVMRGVHLVGVLDGMGAQKAGLQFDDVITALDDHEVTGTGSFITYMGNKRVGDVIDVTYYRCAEKHIAKMTLSGRSIPQIPASGKELASQLESVYRFHENEVGAILKAASEEECARKPAPSEWSANEVLAHLIHSELGWQNIVTEILTGYQGAYDGWGGNVQAHIDGTVETFPSKTRLLEELKNHDAETLSMYNHIPADFLSHKGRWWKLVLQAHDNSNHLKDHLQQIRAAIGSAKQS